MEGIWVDKGKIYDPDADVFAIDGTIFHHEGVDYFIWSGHASASDNTQRLYIAKMANPWTLETSRYHISSPEHPWEKNGDPHVLEGPEILKNDQGGVYLIYSASGCWTDDYALGLLELKENGNPLEAADWEKLPEPVFTKKPEHKVFGPGHNGFFKSPDGTEDWIIYHANAASGDGCKDLRSPRMQKFSWNNDGTPNFGEPVQINKPIPNPSGEAE
jgi:GH43 family beta-xylosidase